MENICIKILDNVLICASSKNKIIWVWNDMNNMKMSIFLYSFTFVTDVFLEISITVNHNVKYYPSVSFSKNLWKMEANYTVHWKRETCCYWKHLQSSGIKWNIKWQWCMHTPHGDFPCGCADVLAVRRSPGSWILSWPWPRLCILKRRAQHSRYSRNERSRFFLLTAPSTAKSSHTTWLQKYCIQTLLSVQTP